MFEGCKKYFLVRYARDCGMDEGRDADTKKEAKRYAVQDKKDGFETIVCVNTVKKRIEFVKGNPCNVLSWFAPEYAAILKANTPFPEFLY